MPPDLASCGQVGPSSTSPSWALEMVTRDQKEIGLAYVLSHIFKNRNQNQFQCVPRGFFALILLFLIFLDPCELIPGILKSRMNHFCCKCLLPVTNILHLLIQGE